MKPKLIEKFYFGGKENITDVKILAVWLSMVGPLLEDHEIWLCTTLTFDDLRRFNSKTISWPLDVIVDVSLDKNWLHF